MSAPKTLARYGVLAKLESTYGTFAAPSASTDGVVCVEKPSVATEYAHDGARAHPTLKRAAKSGRFHTLTVPHEAAGPGTAYSASNLPSPHALMRMSGFDAAVTTTSGSEKVEYTPTAAPPNATYGSCSLEVYIRGQKYQLKGGYAELGIEIESGGIPKWSFEVNGVSQALPADAAVPAITYAGAQNADPAKAEALTLLIGSFSPARVKSASYKMTRGIAPRALDNTSGRHGGFTPGGAPTHTLTVVIESEALASFNPYQLAELATGQTLSLVVGATQYKRWKISAANAVLTNTPEQDEDNTAMWSLEFQLAASAFMANDEVKITFD